MHSIKEIDPRTLVEWMQEDKDFRLVDVRSAAEFAQGMIPKGEGLPLHLIRLRADELERDRDVVLYCRTGARSAQACMFLAERGFDNVYNLRGGIVAWAREGFPLVEAVA